MARRPTRCPARRTPNPTAAPARYDQTIADLRAAVEKALGVPAAKQQLFWCAARAPVLREANGSLQLRRGRRRPV